MSIRFCLVITLIIGLSACGHAPKQVKFSEELTNQQKLSSSHYQKTTINTYDLEEFCADSFGKVLTRNLFGYNKFSNLILTIDRIPIIHFSYDNKTRTCTKDYVLEKDLNQYVRNRPHHDYQLELIFSSEQHVETIRNLVDASEKLVKIKSNTLLEPIIFQVAGQFADHLDSALKNASSQFTTIKYGFKLPDNNKNTKISIKASINDDQTNEYKDYPLLDVSLHSEPSIFQDLTYTDVMNSVRISTAKTLTEEIEEFRNSYDTATLNNDWLKITSECNFLRKQYSKYLNDRDLQIILESYLLSNHRHIREAHIYSCNLDRDGNFIMAELRQIGEANKSSFFKHYDTTFLKIMDRGKIEKIVNSPPNIVDKRNILNASNLQELSDIPNSRNAVCPRFVTPKEVNFIKIIDNVVFYFSVNIDKAYSTAQYNANPENISKVEYIEVSDIPFSWDYKTFMNSCINEELQLNGLNSI